MMLQVNDLHVSYGAILALKGVSLNVDQGEIVTLIGANGAGKSTLLHAISGIVKIASGEIIFEGKHCEKMDSRDIVKSGIVQVPEGRHIFPGLTVSENLSMGAYLRTDRAGIASDLDMVYGLFPVLKERIRQDASTLSGGEQQMLAMGRAMMARPKLLLLDEPSMGLAPILVQAIFNTIVAINKTGTTVLLIEQNAKMALKIAHRGYVIETGRVVLSGTGPELSSNDAVRKAYLGG
jgi:branched-chain amino acid transport system ATP-binding protein